MIMNIVILLIFYVNIMQNNLLLQMISSLVQMLITDY